MVNEAVIRPACADRLTATLAERSQPRQTQPGAEPAATDQTDRRSAQTARPFSDPASAAPDPLQRPFGPIPGL